MMRIVEFMGGIQLPITNEESDMLNKFTSSDNEINKQSLTEREQVIANQLVNKGVLVRKNQNGQIHYRKQIGD
jgi:hypothetical protein